MSRALLRFPYRDEPIGLVRQDEPLPRHDRRATKVIPLLELPDPLTCVAGVVLRSDRPESVRRLHDVGRGLAGTPGRPGSEPYREGDDQDDDCESSEHMFVEYRTRVRPVKGSESNEFRRDPAAAHPEDDHRVHRGAPALRRRTGIEHPDVLEPLDLWDVVVPVDHGLAVLEPGCQPGLPPQTRTGVVDHP